MAAYGECEHPQEGDRRETGVKEMFYVLNGGLVAWVYQDSFNYIDYIITKIHLIT